MTYTIKLRRSLASDWTAVNPVLSEGEFGYELDTRNFKLGDGSTAWNLLEYVIDENDRVPPAALLDDDQILLTLGGQWVVVDLPSGLPDPTGVPDGYMIATVDEAWVVQAIPTSPDELPNPAGQPDGKILTTLTEAWVVGDLPAAGGPVTIQDIPANAEANASPTGLVTASVSPSTTERIVAGMDLTISPSGVEEIGILIDFWWSQNHGGTGKNVTIRIRRDNISGAILGSNSQDATIDSSAGHDRQWSTTIVDSAPTTGHYVVTVQANISSTAIYSDTRTFTLNTGTRYTPVLTDASKFIVMNSAFPSSLVVPPNSSVAFPIGTQIEGVQRGAGQLTIVQGSGVTLRSSPGLKIAAQYGVFGMTKINTDEWAVYGRLST